MSFLKNLILLLSSLAFLIVGAIVIFYTQTPIPTITSLNNIQAKQSIVVTDRNGVFLYDFSENEKRTSVSFDEISPNIVYATIAVEDHKFFLHKGLRLDSFVRAALKNIQTRSFSQGGSTITQQVLKNLFFTNEKKVERKLKEVLLAPKLENTLTKEEILELYLNTISYGGVIYGVAEASNVFFDKDPHEVTVAEAAYLAAIPKAPTYFSPYGRNKPELEERKNLVLEMMFRNSLITREEYLSAKKETVHFHEQDDSSINAPHFVFFVEEQLKKKYGPGLQILDGETIRTTLDFALQQGVRKIASDYSDTIEERFGAKNIAALVLNAKTGEILSMVGSKNFFDETIDGNVNVATSLRQPGSTFKPFAYATAFEKGFLPETVLFDVPTQFGVTCDEDVFESREEDFCYSPVNYTDRFSGPITLRNALAQSVNVPAVKVLYLAGVHETIETAERFGITTLTEDPYHYGLSLVLGGGEVKPLELAQAYSVFASNGLFVSNKWSLETRFAGEKQDKDGMRVLSEKTSKYITDILSDNDARAPVFGHNSPLKITSPSVAVKTGTTNNSRDIWVVGYSPDLVVLVWAGNSDSELLENNASGASLGRLFKDIFLLATKHHGSPNSIFDFNTEPPSIRGSKILRGTLEQENLHTILHFVDKDVPTEIPVTPEENDFQYNNWEFGVQNWLEGNIVSPVFFETDFKQIPHQTLSIISPTDSSLPYRNPTLVFVSPLAYENILYEFYGNGTILGSSRRPHFTIHPEEMLNNRNDTLFFEVIVDTPAGTFYANQNYTFE